MARGKGGARQGTTGNNYSNRSDLRTTQPIQVSSGGAYGDRKTLEDAQRQVPLQNQAGVQGQAMQAAPVPSMFPGEAPAFHRPTERPEEPVTHGAATGPGAGSEGLLPGTLSNGTADRMRALYARFPSEGLRTLIENMDDNA